jgi:hypothetical protein
VCVGLQGFSHFSSTTNSSLKFAHENFLNKLNNL